MTTTILVPKLIDKTCFLKKVKAVKSIYRQDDIVFYDFSYNKESYPLQKTKKEILSMISTTMYSLFCKNFSDRIIPSDKQMDLYYFILPISDRKDSNNLVKQSIALRGVHKFLMIILNLITMVKNLNL